MHDNFDTLTCSNLIYLYTVQDLGPAPQSMMQHVFISFLSYAISRVFIPLPLSFRIDYCKPVLSLLNWDKARAIITDSEPVLYQNCVMKLI